MSTLPQNAPNAVNADNVAAIASLTIPQDLVAVLRHFTTTADDVCFAFQVETRRTVEEIAALDRQWHLGLLPITRGWPGHFCLMIDAR